MGKVPFLQCKHASANLDFKQLTWLAWNRSSIFSCTRSDPMCTPSSKFNLQNSTVMQFLPMDHHKHNGSNTDWHPRLLELSRIGQYQTSYEQLLLGWLLEIGLGLQLHKSQDCGLHCECSGSTQRSIQVGSMVSWKILSQAQELNSGSKVMTYFTWTVDVHYYWIQIGSSDDITLALLLQFYAPHKHFPFSNHYSTYSY